MPSTYKTLGDRQGGDPNIMKLKDVNRVRPLDNVVAGWKQHGIEHPSDPEQFASVVCPGARVCPLDRKPVSESGKAHFPISRRFAANVWDYDTSSIKVMVAGPQVFDKFKEAATVGIDPSSCDWTITKTGQGKGTTYNVIRHDTSPFTAAQVTPDMLHGVEKYEQPDSTEKIFEILEKFGIDYDALTVPSYTYEEALAFVIPYTKHKGLTVEQLLATEPSYAEWMHGTKLEQGQLGDPFFLALQTAMEERGMVKPLEEALAEMPEPEPDSTPVQHQVVTSAAGAPTGQPTGSPSAPPAAVSESSSNMVKLLSPTGDEVTVPPTVVDGMLAAGFSRPAAPVTSTDANAPMKVVIGGNEVELPREQALMLIAAGTAAEVGAEVEPPPPPLPLPDEIVQVTIGGATVPMPYVQAAMVVNNPVSGASFADDAVAEAHARTVLEDAVAVDPSGTPTSASASTAASPPLTSGAATTATDPEKPFACDQCSARYKTQGALTQHKNREHKAPEPQPTAVPAAASTNGNVGERVKDKIAHAPFAKDFTKLLAIFEEEVGEKNFVNMTEEQLLKLEVRIDKEIAAAVG